jgi:hypothetical protein
MTNISNLIKRKSVTCSENSFIISNGAKEITMFLLLEKNEPVPVSESSLSMGKNITEEDNYLCERIA